MAPFGAGGQRRCKDEDDHAQAATDSQSATESLVQAFCVAANKQVRRCKEVPFRQMTGPAARPRLFEYSRPPVVSLRFSSFLVVSRAFCLGSASDAGSEAPELCKTGPIQAKSPRRHRHGLPTRPSIPIQAHPPSKLVLDGRFWALWAPSGFPSKCTLDGLLGLRPIHSSRRFVSGFVFV